MSNWRMNWERAKAECPPGTLLMMREGGHYVLRGEDAEEASMVLGTCLTESREVFVPEGTADDALLKLIRAGKKVALADEVPRRKWV